VTSILATTAGSALADPQSQTFVEQANAEGQNVVFKDDPLAAGGLDPHDARITIRPTGVRTFLLRPRTQFVSEMLKSVENL
jgi:hypothetical protein